MGVRQALTGAAAAAAAGLRDVPEVVRARAVAEGAEAWLADLADAVAEVAARWSLRLGPVLPGATEALVVAATTAAGRSAVLKLVVPCRGGNAAGDEIEVLLRAGGDGCARLLAADEGRGALLLERLGRSMHELGLPARRRQELLCDLAALVWRPAAGSGLRTGAARARWLAGSVAERWEATGRPCSARVVAHAVACAERRAAAHDDERAVLVHGDVHQWNALEAPGAPGGFLLVDPDGLVAEPEYDLGVLLREDPVELLAEGPRARARWLASRTGLDADAIWEWGVVERVASGLRCTEVGLERAAQELLAAAEAMAV